MLKGKDTLEFFVELATALILTLNLDNDPLFEELINR